MHYESPVKKAQVDVDSRQNLVKKRSKWNSAYEIGTKPDFENRKGP
jgi:hypothetical protein